MPLEQCRAQGRWPESLDRFWAKLEQRHGKRAGTRAMVDVLLLGRAYGFERLRAVVEQALEMGVSDVAAIRYLLDFERLGRRLRPRRWNWDGWNRMSARSPRCTSTTACG